MAQYHGELNQRVHTIDNICWRHWIDIVGYPTRPCICNDSLGSEGFGLLL